MLSRSIRRSIASPLRQRFVAPAARPAFTSRFVTTDAASSHAERDQVPEVRTLPRHHARCHGRPRARPGCGLMMEMELRC